MHIISYHFIIIYSQPSPSILPGIVPVKRRPKTRFRRGRPKWKWTSGRKEKAGSGWAGLGIRGRHKTGNDYGGIRGQRSGKVRICFVFSFILSADLLFYISSNNKPREGVRTLNDTSSKITIFFKYNENNPWQLLTDKKFLKTS